MANSRPGMPLTPDQLISSLRWRYATKRFEPGRRIPAETWRAIEESLVLTPSSFGLQPWKFLVITDPEVRTRLATESWGQSQVTEASHYVVLAVRVGLESADINRFMERIKEIQATSDETLAPLKSVIEGFITTMDAASLHAWNARQVYIALGQLMTTAAVLQIDACPMEGLSTVGYDRILGLEGSGYATAVACALGYRAESDRFASMAKVRYEHSHVVQHI